MIFAGCSFTWGQGLHNYSELPNIKLNKSNIFNKKEYSSAHLNFIKTIRFPRLVANHFESFEIVQIENGGNEDVSFNFINHLFEIKNISGNNYLYGTERYEFNDIEYIILQTSSPDRNKFPIDLNTKKYIFSKVYANLKKDDSEFEQGMATFNIFYEWLKINNKTFEEWYNDLLQYVMNNVKEQLIFYEKNGIKTKILNWKSDYTDIIKNDDFLNKRFIKLKYNDKEYNCIDELTNDYPNLLIINDFENLKNPPPDWHPSKECHKIIANSIIKNIEETSNIYETKINKSNGKIYPNYYNLL